MPGEAALQHSRVTKDLGWGRGYSLFAWRAQEVGLMWGGCRTDLFTVAVVVLIFLRGWQSGRADTRVGGVALDSLKGHHEGGREGA